MPSYYEITYKGMSEFFEIRYRIWLEFAEQDTSRSSQNGGKCLAFDGVLCVE